MYKGAYIFYRYKCVCVYIYICEMHIFPCIYMCIYVNIWGEINTHIFKANIRYEESRNSGMKAPGLTLHRHISNT